MSEALPGMIFSKVKGSMPSPDGQQIFLRAETIDGDNLLLGFPHDAINTIIENLAVQLPNGRSARGEPVMTAFWTSGYDIGKGPNGEPVLILHMGAMRSAGKSSPRSIQRPSGSERASGERRS